MDDFRFRLKRSKFAPWYKYKLACEEDRLNDLVAILLIDKPVTITDRIDVRSWFGNLAECEPELPNALEHVLMQAILDSGRAYIHFDGEVKRNWHIRLIQKLIDRGIHVDDNCQTSLEHPNLFGFNRNEFGNIIQPMQ